MTIIQERHETKLATRIARLGKPNGQRWASKYLCSELIDNEIVEVTGFRLDHEPHTDRPPYRVRITCRQFMQEV